MIQDLLNQIDYEIKIDNSSYYFNNKQVPRVTDIISKSIHEEYLMKWSNYLGFKHLSYAEELNKAAEYGTLVHSAIENFLKHNISSDNVSFKAFLRWWNIVNASNEVRIIGEEESLVCEWFGGTYDLLISINNKIYLVDFKTSNHVGYKYYLQLAAYRYMIYKNKNINIDGTILLQLSKKFESFEEYVLDFSIQEHYNFIEQCFNAFLSLVYAYYNRNHIEELYKTIF